MKANPLGEIKCFKTGFLFQANRFSDIVLGLITLKIYTK